MSRYTWETFVGVDQIQNVQSIDINFGRRLRSDSWQSNNAVLSGVSPNLMPQIQIGTQISLQARESGLIIYTYYGTVADYSIDYGIVSTMDRWTMVVEDVFGVLGRTTWSGSIAAQTAVYKSMIALGVKTNVEFEQVVPTPAYDAIPTQALTGDGTPAMDTFNQLANTSQVIPYDIGGMLNVRPLNYVNPGIGIEFTDTTPVIASMGTKFDQIQIGALADTYASQVTVRPDGLAEQTVGTPPRSWVVPTYDSTTSHALETATTLASTLSPTPNQPLSISCLGEQQTNNTALSMCQWQGYDANHYFGARINFRGNKYTCFIEGGSISATPQSTRMSFYFTKIATDYWSFELDSAYFGVLDQNYLG